MIHFRKSWLGRAYRCVIRRRTYSVTPPLIIIVLAFKRTGRVTAVELSISRVKSVTRSSTGSDILHILSILRC